MKITTRCKKCKEDLSINTYVSDRVELAREKGDAISLDCHQCGHRDNYHVDEFSASPSKIAAVVSLSVFLLGTPIVLWLVVGFLGSADRYFSIIALVIPILLPFITFIQLQKNENLKISSFNRHRLKGHNF